MDILDFFWTFYLNHLSPLWGYFLKLSLKFIIHIRESRYIEISSKWLLGATICNIAQSTQEVPLCNIAQSTQEVIYEHLKQEVKILVKVP